MGPPTCCPVRELRTKGPITCTRSPSTPIRRSRRASCTSRHGMAAAGRATHPRRCWRSLRSSWTASARCRPPHSSTRMAHGSCTGVDVVPAEPLRSYGAPPPPARTVRGPPIRTRSSSLTAMAGTARSPTTPASSRARMATSWPMAVPASRSPIAAASEWPPRLMASRGRGSPPRSTERTTTMRSDPAPATWRRARCSSPTLSRPTAGTCSSSG